MSSTSFNLGWRVAPKAGLFEELSSDTNAVSVTLPHDAMLGLSRGADSAAGASSGYFPGGWVEYSKDFDGPAEWRTKRVSLTFEGVYRDAKIFVNGAFAGHRPSGYAEFTVRLDPFLRYGARNTVRVEARAHLDSRWYSGLGIHRPVSLVITELVHIEPNGVRVIPTQIDEHGALVEIATSVRNDDVITQTVEVRSSIVSAGSDTSLGSDTSPVTLAPGASATLRQRIYLAGAARWSVAEPSLYAVWSELVDASGRIVEDQRIAFGVRMLQADPVHGLRINGESVKLRGACLHHDNGVLGAAAIDRAEVRRIELLKAAGFNAIRSAHNPASRAMLDACDRLGMLVMDESFDMWNESLNAFDYSLAFADWWDRDLAAMVAKDVNHPSVIIYSVGNEIPDTGRPLGASWSRQLAERVRELDGTRLITNAVSGFISTIGEVIETRRDLVDDLISQGGANEVVDQIAERMNTGELYDFVSERTAETHATVDIVGHNYAEARFGRDHERYPNRVVVGTESVAKSIDRVWSEVMTRPYAIGDFCWTGWDYLGEAGLGGVMYTDGPAAYAQPWPWLLAWSGDLDITGHRRPQSYYREIVFGLRPDPYLAVRRPQPPGSHLQALGWAWTDSIASWTWDVASSTPMVVEVYADADEVELQLNGGSLGTRPVGPAHRYRAEFEVPYDAGALVAIARTDGEERGRHTLATAGGVDHLAVEVDRSEITADDRDLAFVSIELVDDHGRLNPTADREIRVDVTGAGVLQGLGSARPVSAESYLRSSHRTFEGRLLAVIRPTGVGEIELRISAEGVESVTLRIEAVPGGGSR